MTDDPEREIKRLRSQVEFYRRRCDLLQQWQSRMRDPERTIVCDILANGQTLPDPDGLRYGAGAGAADDPIQGSTGSSHRPGQ